MKKIAHAGLKLLSRWNNKEYEKGYTFLLCLPADLPCMGFLTTEFLKTVDLTHCKEILIMLDASDDHITHAIQNIEFPLPCRIIRPPSSLKTLCRISKSPFKFHWLQIFTGINECRTEWILLKGCNWFINDKKFYKNFFSQAEKSGAIMFGTETRNIEGVTKKPVGTFECLISMEIKKHAKPLDLIAKTKGNIRYDTCTAVQYDIIEKLGKKSMQLLKTPPPKIHFYFLISGYRTLVNEQEKDAKNNNDPYLHLFFLSFMNTLLKGTPWWREDFIIPDDYFKQYTQDLGPDMSRDFKKFVSNCEWVIKNNGLDLKEGKKYLATLKKRVKRNSFHCEK